MNNSDSERVYLTGSSGMLGCTLVKAFSREGKNRVVCLSRDSRGSYVTSLQHLDDSTRCGDSIQTLIHCGWNTKVRSQTEQAACTQTTGELAEFCAKANIRFIFVSSQSASVNAKSTYGRSKSSAESLVISLGGVVVRPGLILFDPPSRLQRYLEVAARLPIRLSISPDPSLLVIPANKLADSLEMLANPRCLVSGLYEVPNTETTLGEYLAKLSPTRRVKLRVRTQSVHRFAAVLKHVGHFGSSVSDSIMALIS